MLDSISFSIFNVNGKIDSRCLFIKVSNGHLHSIYTKNYLFTIDHIRKEFCPMIEFHDNLAIFSCSLNTKWVSYLLTLLLKFNVVDGNISGIFSTHLSSKNFVHFCSIIYDCHHYITQECQSDNENNR